MGSSNGNIIVLGQLSESLMKKWGEAKVRMFKGKGQNRVKIRSEP